MQRQPGLLADPQPGTDHHAGECGVAEGEPAPERPVRHARGREATDTDIPPLPVHARREPLHMPTRPGMRGFRGHGIRYGLTRAAASCPGFPLDDRVLVHWALPDGPGEEAVDRGDLTIPGRVFHPRPRRVLAPPPLVGRPVLGRGVPPRLAAPVTPKGSPGSSSDPGRARPACSTEPRSSGPARSTGSASRRTGRPG